MVALLNVRNKQISKDQLKSKVYQRLQDAHTKKSHLAVNPSTLM